MNDEFPEEFEDERRFFLKDKTIVQGAEWEMITQAYVFGMEGYAIRVRRTQDPIPQSAELTEGRAWLTGKGPRFGPRREEYEKEVSVLWADQVIARCADVIRKRRYRVITNQTWDIDEFLDQNEGLWIAELEGKKEIYTVSMPEWCRSEIVDDARFNNEVLAARPILTWPDGEGDSYLI